MEGLLRREIVLDSRHAEALERCAEVAGKTPEEWLQESVERLLADEASRLAAWREAVEYMRTCQAESPPAEQGRWRREDLYVRGAAARGTG